MNDKMIGSFKEGLKRITYYNILNEYIERCLKINAVLNFEILEIILNIRERS